MYLTKYYHGLSSPRFFFRKLTYDDIVSWMDFYENNPNLKYLGIDLNRTRYEMAKAWIDIQIERYEKNNFGQLGIILKETDELVGTIGLIISKYCKEGTIEIAIAIKPAYWKDGIGKEASVTLINAVFENNFAETIIGLRHMDNYASQKCTQSLGFDEIGVQKEDLRTAVVFRLTKATWIKKHGFYYTTHQRPDRHRHGRSGRAAGPASTRRHDHRADIRQYRHRPGEKPGWLGLLPER